MLGARKSRELTEGNLSFPILALTFSGVFPAIPAPSSSRFSSISFASLSFLVTPSLPSPTFAFAPKIVEEKLKAAGTDRMIKDVDYQDENLHLPRYRLNSHKKYATIKNEGLAELTRKLANRHLTAEEIDARISRSRKMKGWLSFPFFSSSP